LGTFGEQVGVGVENVVVSAGDTSYAAPCLVLKEAGVDGLILGLDSSTAAHVVSDCAQQGFTPALYAVGAVYTPELGADPAFDGMKFTSGNVNFNDGSIPGAKAFQEAMAKFNPQINLAQMSYVPFYSWIAGELFEAAAVAGNIGPDSTPADVQKGLYALKDDTLDGIAPPLTFVPDEATVITCNFSLVLQGGQLTTGNGGELACLSPELAAEVTKMATST
jgi:branched-chain amino acid transport system substrate-binding protein